MTKLPPGTEEYQRAKDAEWQRHEERVRRAEVAEIMAAEERRHIAECYGKATPQQARRHALRKFRVKGDLRKLIGPGQ